MNRARAARYDNGDMEKEIVEYDYPRVTDAGPRYAPVEEALRRLAV